jgi:hypothetical protein
MLKQRKKLIKRGSIRVTKRATLAEIDLFKKKALKMPKQDLIEHIAMTPSGSPTNRIALQILQIIHGMPDENIEKAVNKVKNIKGLKRDLRTYYHGEIPSEHISQKYGISDKNIIDTLAMKDTYEIRPNIGYTHASYDTGTHLKFTEPVGQKPFSNAMYHNYVNFKRDIKKYTKSQTEEDQATYMYLMDIADKHPDYAAVVSYIINGGNPSDDFDMMRNKFNNKKVGTKEKFIEAMKKYKFYNANNPIAKQHRTHISNMEEEYYRRNKELLNQLTKSERQIYANEVQEKAKDMALSDSFKNELIMKIINNRIIMHPTKHPLTKEQLIKISANQPQPSIRDIRESGEFMRGNRPSKINPLIIDDLDSAQNHKITLGINRNDISADDIYDSDRRKRRMKISSKRKIIKKSLKKVIKKPIKKVIRKCRCK